MRRLFLLAILACALSIVPSAGAIIGGQPFAGDEQPYVAFVGDPRHPASCSAVLVSPTVAVTAGPLLRARARPWSCSRTGMGPTDGRPPVAGEFVPHPGLLQAPGLPGDPRTRRSSTPRTSPSSSCRSRSRSSRYASCRSVTRARATGTSGGTSTRTSRCSGSASRASTRRRSATSPPHRPRADRRPNPVLAERFVQIDQESAGFCLGDSGGPVLKKNKHTVIAISSFLENTDTCLGPASPTASTRTPRATSSTASSPIATAIASRKTTTATTSATTTIR